MNRFLRKYIVYQNDLWIKDILSRMLDYLYKYMQKKKQIKVLNCVSGQCPYCKTCMFIDWLNF